MEEILGGDKHLDLISKQLKSELPDLEASLEKATTIKELREVIHGMIGAFHFTGAVRVKNLLPMVSSAAKQTNDIESMKTIINQLRAELQELHYYLDNHYS